MTPTPKTAHELEWQQAVSSGAAKCKHDNLIAMRALSLEEKIDIASANIIEWYKAWDGKVAVSFSGGKDSTVLLWLVRSIYPDVPAVFVNTGLEYPEIVSFVKSTPNVEIMRPRMPFHQVIAKHGWPLISKKVARGIKILRHPTEKNKNIYGLYDRGVNRFGEKVNGFKIAQRWRFLVDAPFECSDACCDIMKKEPVHRYERMTGYKQFIGTLAEDSKQRERSYLMHGCNAFKIKKPRSTPLGFWTEQDILACLSKYGIPYAPVYGQIVPSIQGLACTGAHRTGCIFCEFGLHMEKGETRFQRLYKTHPHLWKYCMEKLGLGEILTYVRARVPKFMQGRFDPEPQLKQTSFRLEVANA